jgi:hypothetical protein
MNRGNVQIVVPDPQQGPRRQVDRGDIPLADAVAVAVVEQDAAPQFLFGGPFLLRRDRHALPLERGLAPSRSDDSPIALSASAS